MARRPASAAKRGKKKGGRPAAERAERLAARLALAERELKEALDKQTALTEVLRATAASPGNAQPVLDAVARRAARLCGASHANVLLQEGGMLRTVATWSFVRTGAVPDASTVVPATRDSMNGRAFVDQKVVHLRDAASAQSGFPGSHAHRFGIRTFLAVPMLREGKSIGTLAIWRREVKPFSAGEIELVRTFADQAAVAIENARLLNETSASLERQIASAEILRAIANSPADVQPVFDTLAANAARLCEANACVVTRYDGKLVYLAAVSHSTRKARDAIRKSFPAPLSGRGANSRAILERAVIHVPDVREDPQYRPGGLAEVVEARSIVAVPLLRGDACLGAIGVSRPLPRPFTGEQIALLKTFADQAVIAIENVRLFNETKEALQHQTASSEVLRIVSRSMADAQPVFQAILDAAMRMFEDFDATVWEVRGDELVVLARGGKTLSVGLTPAVRIVPGSPHAMVVHERRAVRIDDVSRAEDFAPHALDGLVQRGRIAILMVPLVREGAAIGAISVSRTTSYPFSDKQVALLENFADQAVIAIENARLFNETREALEQQTATAEILRVISSSPTDVQPVFEAIAQSAMNLCDTHDAGIALVEGDKLRRVVHRGPIDVPAAAPPLDRTSLVGLTCLEARTIHIADASELDEKEFPRARSMARQFGHRSVLNVPLLRDGKALGVIFLRRQELRPFTERQIALLEAFASQAVIAIENVRLFNETKEALERQTATAEILKVISGSPTDEQPVFDSIVHSAARLFGRPARIRLVDGGFLRLRATSDGLTEGAPMPMTGDNLGGRVFLERRALQISDTEAPEAPAGNVGRGRSVGYRAVAAAPLLRDNAPIGLISVMSPQAGALTDEQMALLQTFADQAVIAIENVRLFKELEARNKDLGESLEQQTATSEILKVISSSPMDVQPVFNAIARSGVQLLGGFSGAVTLRDGDKLQLAAHTHVSESADRAFASAFPMAISSRTIIARAAAAGESQWVSDTETDPNYDGEGRAIARGRGFRSAIAVPMLREDAVIGTISVARQVPGSFDRQQINLLETFAAQAVIAIENVRLFKELDARNRDLTESLEQQTATGEILKVISSSPTDVQPVFDTILRNAVRLTDAEIAAAFRFDGEKVHLAATHNWAREALDYFSRVYPSPPSLNLLSGRTILGKSIVRIPDAAADPHYDPGSTATGHWRRMLGVPMLREGQPLGALVVSWRDPGDTPQHEIDLLQTFADQAVIAIENVRLFNETKEALEQQTAISDILRVISSSPSDVQPVLDAVAERAARICAAPYSDIILTDGPGMRVVAGYGDIARSPREEILPLDRSTVMGRSIVDRTPVHIADLLEHGHEFPRGRDLARKFGHRTLVAVPLLREDKALGTILVRRTEVRPFAEKEIALLKTFADQAAIAIENVRLFKELETRNKDLTESLEQQTATGEILNVISRSQTDVQAVFETIIRNAVRLGDGQFGGMFRFDGKLVDFVAQYNFPPEAREMFREAYPQAPSRDNPLTRSLIDCAVVNVPDIDMPDVADRVRERARVLGYRSQVNVPLMRGDDPIGAIWVGRAQVGPFSDAYIALLKTFADQAVIAIENVRLFKELEARNKDLGQSLDRQTATADILGVIAASPSDVQPVFDAIVRHAGRLAAGTSVNVTRIVGDDLHLAAYSKVSPTADEDLKNLYPFSVASAPGVREAVATRLPSYVADFENDPRVTAKSRAVMKSRGFRSTLYVPIVHGETVYGMMHVSKVAPGPFPEDWIDLLKTFADQAVIAIENVRLFNELDARNRDLGESLEQQTATSEVLKVISRTTTDLEPVLQIVLDNARRLCDADRVQIFRSDNDGAYRTVAASGDIGPASIAVINEKPIRVDRSSATGRALVERRTIHIPDVAADPEYGRMDIAQAGGYRTILAVPMLREGAPVGVLTVARGSDVRPYTDKQIALVTTFADQAVIAIENVRLFSEIQEKTAQLEVANKHKSEFLANMSHELRTPLNAVIGFSEVLMERMFGEVNEKQADYLKDIHESGRHLLSLINDILDLSKIEAGRMELDLSTFHLPTAVSNAMTLIRERAQRHGVALGSEIDERLGDFQADERKVKQVLLNLLSNAVKFTPEGGRVEVSAKLDTDHVEIAVRDSGIGISAEDQAKLFGAFTQVGQDSARKAEGTGLGLALTKKFVELHGGAMRVQSAPGQGSTFAFTLPVRP